MIYDAWTCARRIWDRARSQRNCSTVGNALCLDRIPYEVEDTWACPWRRSPCGKSVVEKTTVECAGEVSAIPCVVFITHTGGCSSSCGRVRVGDVWAIRPTGESSHVPLRLREAGAGCGATHWRTLVDVHGNRAVDIAGQSGSVPEVLGVAFTCPNRRN